MDTPHIEGHCPYELPVDYPTETKLCPVESPDLPTADVVVIGGGLIGSAIGWRLAQAGASMSWSSPVNRIAAASQVAAGMLAPISETTFTEQPVCSARSSPRSAAIPTSSPSWRRPAICRPACGGHRPCRSPTTPTTPPGFATFADFLGGSGTRANR